jgi:aspartyl-tRNA(Asn)/glutamyl-tRNA(Gln) amidotransferase subunit A
MASELELVYLPASEAADHIRTGRLSSLELVEAVLRRTERLQPKLNAFTFIRYAEAREEAERADNAVRSGKPLAPLHGVPVTVKDNLAMAGVRSTSGSRLMRDHLPTQDAVSVERLRQAGAIIIGRTNTPEFAWRGSTDNRLYGETRNPWNLRRTAGGSSGGAGAAVASGLAPLALGTDGAGSIRIPSSFCGIFGLKPSIGRIPLDGHLGLMETAANVGPMTRTVRDAALLLDLLAGPDDRDRNSLPETEERFQDAPGKSIKGMRIAWSPNLGHIPVEPEILEVTEAATQVFRELGCKVDEYDAALPDPAPILDVFYASVQAGAHGRRPDNELAEMDPDLVKLVEKAKTLTAVDVGQMAFARARYWDTIRRIYERYDLLITPTLSVSAFKLGIVGPAEVAGQPVIHLGWSLAYPFNLTGQPAATVPCGFTSDGMPIGLQIVGPRFGEASVLQAAAAFEEIRPWQDAIPPIDGVEA